MILEVDMGNSRTKWRLREGATVVNSGSGARDDFDSEQAFYKTLFAEVDSRPDAVLVATVVVEVKQAFKQWCEQHWQLAPRYSQVTHHCAGVTNGYRDISQMGVDRWLAMLASYNEVDDACLVVDVGTALTVDLISASGQHLGGYIAPGLTLMGTTLLTETGIRDTSRVVAQEIGYHAGSAPGDSTRNAISAGLVAMQLGLVEQGLRRLQQQHGAAPVLVLSGGGAEAFMPLLQGMLLQDEVAMGQASFKALLHRPSLVLDGLSYGISD